MEFTKFQSIFAKDQDKGIKTYPCKGKKMRMRQVEERYTPQELREYEASKIAYRDIKNSVDTAKREGIAEGMEKGMEKKSHEIAKKMLTKGMDEATVMEITGLSAEMIQQLKAEM